MSNLTDALIAAKLVGGSGGSGGGSGLPEVTADDNGDVLTVVDGEWGKATPSGGSVLPPFKSFALVLSYDSTEKSGEGRIYRCKDGQFERTHIVTLITLEPDIETGDNKVVVGPLETEEGASAEDISDAAEYGWLSERVTSVTEQFGEDDVNTLWPLMLFIS